MPPKPRVKIPVHVAVYTIAFIPGAVYGKKQETISSFYTIPRIEVLSLTHCVLSQQAPLSILDAAVNCLSWAHLFLCFACHTFECSNWPLNLHWLLFCSSVKLCTSILLVQKCSNRWRDGKGASKELFTQYSGQQSKLTLMGTYYCV